MKSFSMKLLSIFIVLSTSPLLFAKQVVNVYGWGTEIPKEIIHQFEEETGIDVNFSAFDTNETMYAKLKTSRGSLYDVIVPSSYYVERMEKQGMLTPIDKTKLPNLINLNPYFTRGDYDPENKYSIPLVWGTTGIFYNQQRVKNPPTRWRQLWETRWRSQLMLLDDSREIFSMALLSLGFDANDTNPSHIQLAFKQLLALVPNVKLFASDSIQALMIDEDSIIGTSWNSDTYKAQTENSNVQFSYPEEGFVIWVDCLAIPVNPPHLQEAYAFINFMLRPETAKQIALTQGYPITNQKGFEQLPDSFRLNPMLYPDKETLKRGHFQRDVGEETLSLYNQYWQQLKLAF